MALNIKDPETDRLVRELAKATGQTVTFAVRDAVREKIERISKPGGRSLAEDLMSIGRRCARLRDRDRRSADEIIGYDEHGLPT